MPGLERDTPIPTEITLDRKRRVLVLTYGETAYELTFEYLRVMSPSAEVRGHGPGQEVLQVGKRDVDILELEPVGMYAIKPRFSDGHDTGIYSWDFLYDLAVHHEAYWADYLRRLEAAGASRDASSAAGAST
ncbi:MAG: gamma-butyrobetaine hydroxylase-like domain-containing protein [Casimicrobiaceae bacterium]